MGYQTGIPQTDHGLLETVLLDQDDNLSADPDERATGYQAELRLETQWPEHNRENFDHNQTVTLERPIHHQVSDYVLALLPSKILPLVGPFQSFYSTARN